MVQANTTGLVNFAASFFKEEQLKDRVLWKKFADQFRTQYDSANNGWRGEYWGKMMRGGALIYEFTRDEELYDVITESVRDMLTVAESDGRVSTYSRESEFNGWDMWCRKYVILACEYYLDICRDESLRGDILSFIQGCADYIIARVGQGEGKTPITETSRAWCGMNACSILEPSVKLYRLTGDRKYLDFATYIVDEGGAKGINIFELAYKNEVYPYQYGVSKAYEMISCFEGLLEYYYATGIEKYKTAVVNFANAIIESELSVIGCSGITHELFDHTSTRQTVRYEGESQETCVTVTWMKFCARLLALTGESKFADCMEQSFYNAYLSTLNTEHNESTNVNERAKGNPTAYTFIPADSYSPLIAKRRGTPIGGFQFLPDGSYYGCCACIASAGVGMLAKSIVTADERGITVNFFESGTYTLQYGGATVVIKQETDYPLDGKIRIFVSTSAPVSFKLRIRIPAWSGKSGYEVLEREWSEDEVTVDYPMELRTQLPKSWDEDLIYVPGAYTARHKDEEDNYIALFRGPITLAVDSRMGKAADSVFDFEPVGEVCDDREIAEGVPCLLKMRFTDRSGETFYLVDYSSAGKDWKTEIAAWLRTE